MRIDPPNNPTPLPIQADVATGVTSSGAAGKPPEGARVVPESKFTPTVDLAKLLDAVRKTPDVRTDVVDEVASRVAAGDLNTPDAAKEAAAAFYNSVDG